MAAQQVETYNDKPSYHHQQPCQGNAEEELDLQRPWAGLRAQLSNKNVAILQPLIQGKSCWARAGTGAFSHIAEGRGGQRHFTPQKVKHSSSFFLLKVILKIETAASSFCFHLILFPPCPSMAICFSTGSSLGQIGPLLCGPMLIPWAAAGTKEPALLPGGWSSSWKALTRSMHLPKRYAHERCKCNLGTLSSRERPERLFPLIIKTIIKQHVTQASPLILNPWAQTSMWLSLLARINWLRDFFFLVCIFPRNSLEWEIPYNKACLFCTLQLIFILIHEKTFTSSRCFT